MNKFIGLILLVLVFTGCDKVKQVHKDLEGEWQIITYRRTNDQGLTYFLPADGTLQFTSCSNAICSYDFNFSYEDQGVISVYSNSGSLNQHNHEHFDLFPTVSSGDSIYDGRILLITKDDLKMLYNDGVHEHYFVLEK